MAVLHEARTLRGIHRNSSPIAWPATFARVIVLLAIGLAGAFAANNLRRQVVKRARDQDRIQLLSAPLAASSPLTVARQILDDKNWMSPALREAVVMFADHQGFHQILEKRSPEEVAGMLNKCWSVAADIVEHEGGVINKYLGDGFLAIFGVPLELKNAAELQLPPRPPPCTRNSLHP